MRKSLPYDLDLVHEKCNEVGLSSELIEPNTLAVDLTGGVTLRFVNNVTTHFLDGPAVDDDALIDMGDETSWHTHGHEFQFADPRGHYISMDYLDLVAGIASGEILIAELWNKDNLKDRWLIHKDYNDEFDYLETDDEIRVRRVFPTKQRSA